MNTEAFSTLLLEAATLLAIGMTFVFLFLALLIAAINLIAAFCKKFPGKFHADLQPTLQHVSHSTDTAKPDDKTVAIISAAVHQYRKQHQLNVKD